MNKHQCPASYVPVTETRTIQKLILQLMVQFHEICEKHHLIYNMCGGTLLGAVRHKGFIPWDDDMDVCMPRNDYDKFVKIAKTQCADKFDIIAAGDEGCIYPYAKICMKNTLLYEKGIRDKYHIGLFLDIFPIDGYPGDDVINDEKMVDKLKRVSLCLGYCVSQMNISATWWKKFLYPVKLCILGIFRLISPVEFIMKYDKIVRSYCIADCEEVTWYWVQYFEHSIAKEKFFDRICYDFEGYRFWSVKDYDAWLSRQYGDYMTPPPVNKRVNAHGFELFVKNGILESLEVK